MTSAFERYKNRQNRAMEVEVLWPSKKPEFIFKVIRFAQTEFNAAGKDAAKGLRDAGIEPDDLDDKERPQKFTDEFCEQLAKYVKRHIKGWVHKPADGSKPVDYSSGLLEGMFVEMNRAELADLGAGYIMATGEEEKKTEAGTSSEPASLSD